MKKRVYKVLAVTLLIFSAGCIILGIMRYFGWHIPCTLEVMTGFKCPACGATRASMRLLTLDIKGAWEYNPMVFFIWLYLGKIYVELAWGYIKFGYFTKRRADWFDISGVVIIVLWGIVRNILGV